MGKANQSASLTPLSPSSPGPQVLPRLPSLIELAIERCPGAAQLPALWQGLPRCNKLRVLRITGGSAGSRLPSGIVFGSGGVGAHSPHSPAFGALASSGQRQPAAHAFAHALAAGATVPDSIALLQQLRRLDLRNNGLQLLPDSLAWCQQLTAVHLGGNRLAGVPTGLAALGGLRLLDLSCNQVRGRVGLCVLCSVLRLCLCQVCAWPAVPKPNLPCPDAHAKHTPQPAK